MPRIPLIDLHCDTLYEIEKKGESLHANSCAVSLSQLTPYPHYAQFFAAWCNKRLSDDEGFAAFLRMADYFDAQLSSPACRASIRAVRTVDELHAAWDQGVHAAILAVEDARILGGKLERLDVLAERGVRYLTLHWNGDSCIGGAFNTTNGLTDFGKAVVKRCFALGIVPDISHASEQSAEQTLALAAEASHPILATHSNAYTVYPHPRNLRDRHFEALRDGGGLVGLNFCHSHLCDTQAAPATVADVIRHLEHYLSLDGENTVAFGCDWDGAGLPEGFSTIADAIRVADELARLGYSNELIEKLFFGNALAFIDRSF